MKESDVIELKIRPITPFNHMHILKLASSFKAYISDMLLSSRNSQNIFLAMLSQDAICLCFIYK